MDTPEVLAATNAFYRSRVYQSWVFKHLYDRHLADIVKPAGIGYAPKGWTTTANHLRGLGATDDQLVNAGVATHARDGSVIDVLRDRMVFPITNVDTELAGFIGRAPSGSDEPKYVNSPASAHFNKSRLLYGLGDQMAELRAGAQPIIVEGPLDRWGVHRAQQYLDVHIAGVAPCGTALTTDQFEVLLRHSRTPPIFAFDNDGAGQKATLRAWTLTHPMGNADLRVLTLPRNQDPADLHPKQLAHLVKHAEPMAVTVARLTIAEWGGLRPGNTARTTLLIQELAHRDLLRVPPAHINTWLRAIARELRTDPQTVNAIAFSDPSPPHISMPGPPTQLPQHAGRAHTR